MRLLIHCRMIHGNQLRFLLNLLKFFLVFLILIELLSMHQCISVILHLPLGSFSILREVLIKVYQRGISVGSRMQLGLR